jgi:TonB-dependent SusC/RagA subfamily outer membrane receptor
MRKNYFLLLLTIFFSCLLMAQQSLQHIARRSYQILAYRIPADTAVKYVWKGIGEIDHYLQKEPVMKFSRAQLNYDTLPVGNYLLISVDDTMVVAEYYNRTHVLPYIINSQVRPQILLRDESGNAFTNAKVWVNKEEAKYSSATGTFVVKQKRPDEAIVKIIANGDTSFIQLEVDRENGYTIKKQKAQRRRSTKLGRMINWFPDRIKYMVKTKPKYWFRKRNKKSTVLGKGYVLFNKPKYFPSDTIMLKAYLMNRKGKQYNGPVQVYLSYYHKNTSVDKLLTTLKAVTPGAYVHQFATGDTLPNDTRYNLRFVDKKKKVLLNGGFKIEDYVLDEVATYSVSSLRSTYYSGDSIRISASAKDANGLAVMDGRVKLILTTTGIKDYHSEGLFVPDTLWVEEKTLAVDGDTKFNMSTINLPQADLTITAKAIFRNSNDEIQEKTTEISYNATDTRIEIMMEDGFINANFLKNGKEEKIKGFMETDLMEEEMPITFPYTVKIDPQVEQYEFFTRTAKGELDEYETFEPERNYNLSFNRTQNKDTVGFLLYNPNKVPVYYALYDKDKEIFAATSAIENIEWKAKMPVGKIYYLRWQYYWRGEERSGNQSIALLSKLMAAEIGGAPAVYPGQKDTITIKVKDYINREVKGANLTVASYNTQFSKDIKVPEPPYIEKFRGKQPLLYDEYTVGEVEVKNQFTLGKHQSWRKRFELDTMPYYRFLFPDSNFWIVKTRIQQLLPQVAVYAVQNGVPQEIYMLYINRQLVYYNGVTNKGVNAVSRFPGYAQIIVRLKDKIIEADSVYLQPNYKHDIVFDVDKTGKHYKVSPADNFWSYNEKDLLNKQILRVENNYRNNGGYVWQDDKAYYLNSAGEHIAGPFVNNDSIQFYKPGDFDFKFSFEPGYRYRVSPQIVRLEKIPLIDFNTKVFLPAKMTTWVMGDTIIPLPVISYVKPKVVKPLLEQYGSNYYGYNNSHSRIQIQMPKDSAIAITVLHYTDSVNKYKVLWGGITNLYDVPPGNYSVTLITRGYHFLTAQNIKIPAVGTYCIKFDKPVYVTESEIIRSIQEDQVRREKAFMQSINEGIIQQQTKDALYANPEMKLLTGAGIITGKIIDAKGGDPIVGTSIRIKGYTTGTAANTKGEFFLSKVPAGKYVLVFASVGYLSKEVEVEVIEGESPFLSVKMEMSKAALHEVVVVAYGTTRKKNLTGSISVIRGEEFSNVLQGRLSGVQIDGSNGLPGNTTSIQLRGIGSFKSNADPLIIIDGVIADKAMLDAMSPNDVGNISILKDGSATAIYGARAANGVIIVTTKGFSPKILREEFRDYAFWKPNLITDENGAAKFEVTYPDNITSWQTFVVGMDKKNRMVKTSKIVKSFKPMMAQLATPSFLVEGDSVTAVGKKVNYTSSDVNVSSTFSINSKIQFSKDEVLRANDATTASLTMVAEKTDTIIAKFTMTAATGFADGELRKIPILKKGTIETIGQFNVLEKDTSISILVNPNAGKLILHAQNNTLEVLLDEIEHLKKYPYYCMEQTASKLTGLVTEKKIREALRQPFTNQKEMQKLLEKIQKAQLFDGGWGWWDGSEYNIDITNYILRALLAVRGDAVLETNIRNGLLFLHNQLPKLDKYLLLESLYTLSEANHDMDYNVYLKRLTFDSLTQHQQWQIIAVLQKQQMNYSKELANLFTKKTQTMLGGLHWGEQNYWWSRNDIATTVLAYKILRNNEGYSNEQQQIRQYFIEKRKDGHWRNTVESASILAAILPDVLSEHANFNSPAQLVINMDTTFTVNKFPFTLTTKPSNNLITVNKQGGGMVYFTAYQHLFNKTPLAVDSNFSIKTYFENNGATIKHLKAGEKVAMKVEVNVLKDAEYVHLEMPIPAGCTYGTKANIQWNEYREYFRDRVMIFAEKLNKGVYTYTIELEPRYSGTFTLNPAKAQLMYFPTFYGRNEIKTVTISK